MSFLVAYRPLEWALTEPPDGDSPRWDSMDGGRSSRKRVTPWFCRTFYAVGELIELMNFCETELGFATPRRRKFH
jgi:hypothetical protein